MHDGQHGFHVRQERHLVNTKSRLEHTMKIEKKKVLKGSNINSIAKNAIAVTLGLSATFTMNACEDTSSALHDGADINSSNDTAVSSSGQEQAPSSSSKIIDIPRSYAHYSSSVIEALSSAAQPRSSSSVEQPSSAGDLVPIESSSSSSSDIEIKIKPEDHPVIKDTLIPEIHLCDDPNNSNCHMLIESMVTTLETNDIA